jgi:hypothetical protein
MVDGIEYQAHGSGPQVSITSPKNSSVNKTTSAKPSTHRSKKKARYVMSGSLMRPIKKTHSD